MIMENEKRIRDLLKNRKLRSETDPNNYQLYEKRLLEAFQMKRDSNLEYFYPNTFEGSDREDYLACRKIFDGKDWNQIDFDSLYINHVQFLMLNEHGVIYYLPAFLRYFYDLRRLDSEFFNSIMGKLSQGLCVPTSDQLQIAIQERKYPVAPADFSAFERLNPIQSKLVAVFLVNVANLLPTDWFDSSEAQRALTNYWGNFLLF